MIVAAEPVEGKDKLSAIEVDIGDEEPVKIVTNAPNAKEGNRIVVATVGATVSSIATCPAFFSPHTHTHTHTHTHAHTHAPRK